MLGVNPTFDSTESLDGFVSALQPSDEQLAAGAGIQTLQLTADLHISTLTHIASIRSLTSLNFDQSLLYGPSYLSCFLTIRGERSLPNLIHFVAIRSRFDDHSEDDSDVRLLTVAFLLSYTSLRTCELPLIDRLLDTPEVLRAAFALPCIKRLQLDRREDEPLVWISG